LITVIGSYVSPFVRKVLACLELKELDYRIDPITPFFGDERFDELSPLRRVPVFIDDQVTLADSSVITQYVDERHPDRYRLLPADVADRARARWLEEYADTRIADVILWGVFRRAVLDPGIWGKPRELDAILRVMQQDLPPVMDYLERQLPASGFLFDPAHIGLADVSIAVHFRNLGFARQRADATRWPIATSFVDRVLAQPALTKLQAFEEKQVRTPVAQQREVLAAMGAPLAPETVGGTEPRPGAMSS
jgi:glutathione S-transferase